MHRIKEGLQPQASDKGVRTPVEAPAVLVNASVGRGLVQVTAAMPKDQCQRWSHIVTRDKFGAIQHGWIKKSARPKVQREAKKGRYRAYERRRFPT